MERVLARHSLRTYASSIAWHPPCPKLGIIACTASPISTTLPWAQLRKSSGRRSYKSLCSTSSGDVASNTVITSSVHPSCNPLIYSTKFSSLSPCSDRTEPPHPLGAFLVPGGKAKNAYHWIRPSPTSLVTKYRLGPMYTLYPVS